MKELVLFTRPDKPFERTAKGSVRTGLVIDLYAEEIDRAYKLYDEQASPSSSAKVPDEWTKEQSKLCLLLPHSLYAHT